MSVREFSADVARALSRVEAGEILVLVEDGRQVVELRPSSGEAPPTDDDRARARMRMTQLLERGIPGLNGPASYDERTGR